ncbi:MAG: hypothetical protein R2882_13075 [Gemmatimonadales bacterium]
MRTAAARCRVSRGSLDCASRIGTRIWGTPNEVPVPRSVRRISGATPVRRFPDPSRLVVPARSNGTPPVTTNRSPGQARPFTITSRASTIIES